MTHTDAFIFHWVGCAYKWLDSPPSIYDATGNYLTSDSLYGPISAQFALGEAAHLMGLTHARFMVAGNKIEALTHDGQELLAKYEQLLIENELGDGSNAQGIQYKFSYKVTIST